MEQQDYAGTMGANTDSAFYDDVKGVRTVMQNAGIGIWEFRAEEAEISADSVIRELFGLRAEERLSYVEAMARVHPDDVNRVSAAYRAASQAGNGGHFDVQCRIAGLPGAKLRWVRFSGQVFFNPGGALQRLSGIAQDMSAMVEATQSAREALSLSEMALQSAGAGSFLIHLESGRMEYSPALARIYTGDESLAVDRELLIAHLHPDDRETRRKAYLVAEQTGRLHYDARAIWNDGSVHWIEVQAQYLMDHNGKPQVLTGFAQDVTDRKLAHLALEEREQQVFDSFDQAPVGIAIIGKDRLSFRMANTFYSQLVARRPEELIGRPLLEALPELEGQGFDDILNGVLATGTPFIQHEAQVDLIRGGRSERIYVDFIYQAMRDANGTLSDVMVVVTDVTNQVQSRERLRASESKFRSLIEEAPFPTALYVGPDLIIDTANNSMIALWGKTPEVIGMPLAAALPELEGQPFIGLLQQIRRTGETYHARSAPADLIVGGTLQRFWFSYTYKALYDLDGNIYAVLNMALDVTEEVEARRKQEETQNALVNAIELAELGTWSLDIGNGTLIVSARMKDWFGLETEAGQLSDALSAILPEDRPRVAAAIAEATKPGAATYSVEYRVRNKQTGQLRFIHAQGRIVADADGNPLRLDGTARDTTLEREMQLTLERLVQERTEELAATNEELRVTNEELQATNEELAESNNQLQHSNEELAQYAYVASHDLQEPLRKIRVFSGMLDKSGRLDANDSGLVRKISHSAERMAMLIKDLLEFSKLLNSEAIWHPVRLGDLVSAIRGDFELLLAEKDATIEIGTLPVVEAVGLQMNQLFYNLIGNALKFVKAGVPPHIVIDSVPISREEAAPYVGKPLPFANYHRISVTDNGIGFDVQYTEQIFEVFKRLHGREVYPGSGIGLALCRRITANHMGGLYAESEPGKGSVFYVILPDRQEEFISTLPESFTL